MRLNDLLTGYYY